MYGRRRPSLHVPARKPLLGRRQVLPEGARIVLKARAVVDLAVAGGESGGATPRPRAIAQRIPVSITARAIGSSCSAARGLGDGRDPGAQQLRDPEAGAHVGVVLVHHAGLHGMYTQMLG